MLFGRRPIRQLDDAVIAVTDESSTTAMLLRLILEERYKITPTAYQRGRATETSEAWLAIGDEALKARQGNQQWPYETDLAFEWWLWQHLPAVFAVWAVRKDLPSSEKQQLSRLVQHQLAANLGRLDAIAQAHAERLGIPAAQLAEYLSRFVYRFGENEEQAIQQFQLLLRQHGLLE